MATWNIDPTHSEIQFKAKHLVISTVTGNFKSFNGKIETKGESFEGADVYFEADIDSITTNNEDRDNHLKSDDFFNAEKFPQLTFESTSFKKNGDDSYDLTGKLTIRDVTKEVTLKAEHGGTVDDPYGQTKAGFEITGSVNRKEFNLTWNAVTEAGSVVVGDAIKLQMNVQVVKN
ncbi:MAG: YceI family protein [Balneolaceae bacterium]